MKTAYEACLREMFALHRFGIKLGLDVIGTILKRLGNPHEKFKSIHIAGTNGKGSVAAYLSSILCKSGVKTGMYTSPHLIRFNERVRINEREITDADVVESYKAVKDAATGLDRSPTFFEYTTAMAFHLFGKAGVNWAVIETGMGGRLDATNILNPVVSIITNISLEHREYLGDTIGKIAFEKAGIIKPQKPVITGINEKEAFLEVEAKAKRENSPLFRLGRDFDIRINRDGSFDYSGLESRFNRLSCSLAGEHQPGNAALAIAAIEAIGLLGNPVSNEDIAKGLMDARWPGRLELRRGEPDILIDGSHNPAAAKQLAQYLEQNATPEKTILVIGVLDDKAYEQILALLLPLCRHVILTRAKIDRGLDPEILLDYIKSNRKNPSAEIIMDVEDAIKKAISVSSNNDLVCIAGSLYVAGEAIEALDNC